LLDDVSLQPVTRPADLDDENLVREKMLDCLDRCTKTIGAAKRDLILRYYIGQQRAKIQNRQALAQELGISVNALSIRACRIREELGACVRQCVHNG
jgi:DNA-directed RNA polymerase specialized sigma24 family protein